MKKVIILSLLATFMAVFTASAEDKDNTYSMVIKMVDGTVFTIGPNEVDSLSFSDGKLTVAGSSVKDIVDAIQANKVYNEAQSAEIAQLQAQIAQLQHDLEKMSYMHKADVDDLKAVMAKQQSQIDYLQNQIEELKKVIAAMPVCKCSSATAE
ncbi:MAG: hypothetical protein IJ533_03175 [Prevotella sp.]|nr:hypothetical protein [Prevotella sp.]